MAAEHRAVGQALDQVECPLTIASLHQSFIGNDRCVKTSRQWLESLHAADVGTRHQ